MRLVLRDGRNRSRRLDGRIFTAVRLAKRRGLAASSAGVNGRDKLFNAEVVRRLLGINPVRLEAGFARGPCVSLAVPDDLGNFISDVYAVIVVNQYDAGDLGGLTVVDAGANIGLFSLYACLRGARRVLAFEPVAETFALLRGNVARSGVTDRVVCFPAALGRARGSGRMFCNTRGDGSARLSRMSAAAGRRLGYEAVRRTQILALDDVVRERVDFLKIDVEGQERNVLLGGRGLIARNKPVISMAAYHRREDSRVLPRTLLGIRGDYLIGVNSFAERDFICR